MIPVLLLLRRLSYFFNKKKGQISDPYDMISGDPSQSSIKARASPLLDFTNRLFQLPRSRNPCYRRATVATPSPPLTDLMTFNA
ncbi:hypothetical protein CR513_01614, partial [Mucuna pruriens]